MEVTSCPGCNAFESPPDVLLCDVCTSEAYNLNLTRNFHRDLITRAEAAEARESILREALRYIASLGNEYGTPRTCEHIIGVAVEALENAKVPE